MRNEFLISKNPLNRQRPAWSSSGA